MKELTDATGETIAWRNDQTDAGPKQSAGAAASSSGDTVQSETIADLKNKKRIAEKAGFSVGTNVINKKSKDKLTITEMRDDAVVMQVYESALTATVDYKTLLDGFRENKSKLCAPAEACTFEASSPSLSADWILTGIKGAVALAMQQKLSEAEAGAYSLCTPFENPIGLRATADIDKGALRLVCATQRIDRKESTGCISVGSFRVGEQSITMYASQQLVLPLNKDGDEVKNPWLSHFWCVEKVASGHNLELVWEQFDVLQHTVFVPILTNPKKIKQGETLKRFKFTGTAMHLPTSAKKPRKA